MLNHIFAELDKFEQKRQDFEAIRKKSFDGETQQERNERMDQDMDDYLDFSRRRGEPKMQIFLRR